MAQNEITTVLKLNLEGDATSKFETAAASAKKFTSSTDRLIKNLELERIALEKGKDAMLLHKAAMEGATLDQLAHIKSTQAAIQAKKQEALSALEAANSEDYLSDQKQQGKTATDRLIQSLQIQEKEMREGKTAALVYRAALDGATKEQQELIAKLHQSVAAQNASNAAMGAGGRQARFMRGMFGQMGHQVQDVAVQMQMGTNAMLVFGQQGSQIASLLGPWGSIAGAAISIGAAMATFYSASGQAKKATSELEKTLQSLSETIEVDLGNNTRQLTQDFINLANTSSALAEVTIRQQYLQALKAGNLANEAFSASTSELIRLTKQLGQVFYVNNSQLDAGAAAIANIQSKFGLTADEATSLAEAIRSVSIDQANISQLEDMLTQMAVSTKSGNQEFIDFAANVLESARQMKTAEEQAAFLKEVIGVGLPEAIKNLDDADLGGVVQDATTKTTSSIASLRRNLLTDLEKLNEDYYKNFVALNQNTELSEAETTELKRRLSEQYFADLKEMQQQSVDERVAEEKRFADALADVQKGILADIDRQAKEQERLRSSAQAVEFDAMSEIDQIKSREQQKLEALREAEEAGIQLSLSYAEIRKRIAEETAEAIIDSRLKEGNISELQRAQIEGTRQRAEFEKKTERDKTTFVLGELDNQLSGISKYNKKAFAIQKAVQIAQAIMNTHTAATKALAAYPPPLGAVFAALAVANGMAQVAQIKSQSFEGGGFTGTGSRSGGVDGKGGFPAILHPNETVIDHTKGQGMGGITIVNNIDASGAGSEVDQKIMMAMEVTSQQTVKQVQDLLRRQRLV